MSGANGAGDVARNFSAERRARYDEFNAAMKAVSRFVRDPIMAVEAIADDPTATHAERVLAWAKRKAWGNYSLVCIHEDGSIARQTDCAVDLKIATQRVSDAIKYQKARGRIHTDGQAIYPVISPVPGSLPEKGKLSGEYRTFLELWKVTHSADFLEWESAHSTLKRLNSIRLLLYKKWRASGHPSLLTSSEDSEDGGETGGRSSVKEREPVATAALVPPRPPASPPSIREKLKTWLIGTFRIPTALDDAILAKIAAHIPDEAVLEQFKIAAANVEAPRKWAVFVRVAEDCAGHFNAYAAAAHANTGLRLDRKAQAELDQMNRVNAALKRRFGVT